MCQARFRETRQAMMVAAFHRLARSALGRLLAKYFTCTPSTTGDNVTTLPHLPEHFREAFRRVSR